MHQQVSIVFEISERITMGTEFVALQERESSILTRASGSAHKQYSVVWPKEQWTHFSLRVLRTVSSNTLAAAGQKASVSPSRA